jgi:hypothetical protein
LESFHQDDVLAHPWWWSLAIVVLGEWVHRIYGHVEIGKFVIKMEFSTWSLSADALPATVL